MDHDTRTLYVLGNIFHSDDGACCNVLFDKKQNKNYGIECDYMY